MAVVVRRVQTYAAREYLDAGPEDLRQLSSRAIEPLKCMRRQKSWREHGLLELMLVRRAKIAFGIQGVATTKAVSPDCLVSVQVTEIAAP